MNTVDYDWDSDTQKVDYLFDVGYLTMEEIEEAANSGLEYQDWRPLITDKLHTGRIQCLQFCTMNGISLVVYVSQPATLVVCFLKSGKTASVPLVTETKELLNCEVNRFSI